MNRHAIQLVAILVLTGLVLTAGSSARQQDNDAPDQPVFSQYARIGIIPFKDESGIRDGSGLLLEKLIGRLGARFDDVEFVKVEPDDTGIMPGPVLLDEAVELGGELGIDAVLDGVFSGVDIVGGTWPNIGSDVPQARGFARWRLVDCRDGLLAADGEIRPKHYRIYSKRIKSTEKLVSRVMQDLVDEIAGEIEQTGLLLGTDAEETGEQSPEEAGGEG